MAVHKAHFFGHAGELEDDVGGTNLDDGTVVVVVVVVRFMNGIGSNLSHLEWIEWADNQPLKYPKFTQPLLFHFLLFALLSLLGIFHHLDQIPPAEAKNQENGLYDRIEHVEFRRRIALPALRRRRRRTEQQPFELDEPALDPLAAERDRLSTVGLPDADGTGNEAGEIGRRGDPREDGERDRLLRDERVVKQEAEEIVCVRVREPGLGGRSSMIGRCGVVVVRS